MENIILLFVCLFLGVLFQKIPQFPKNSHQILNQYVIHISIPALALYYIPKIKLSIALLYPLGIAWIGFSLSFLFFYTLGTYLNWSKKLIGCLILTAGLGNTSFVGFPLIQAMFGEKALKTAIIVDQPGSFVVVATLGILGATFFSSGTTTLQAMGKKILYFPPFIFFMIALFLALVRLDFPPSIQHVFLRLGNTVTPIALVAVGLQLKIDKKSKHWGFLALGLFFKLFLTPLFFFTLYTLVLKQNSLDCKVSIVESAMAPMITAAIVASSYGLKPKLSSMMVAIGIPLSLVTTWLWYYFLMHF